MRETLSRVSARLSRFLATDGFFVVALFATTRAVLELIGVVSRILLDPLHPRPPDWLFSSSRALDVWGVWDTGWYVGLADGGYAAGPAGAGQVNTAFFPLYPLLMRGAGKVVGGSFNGGLLVSNVCLLLACFLLFDLVERDEGRETARRAVTYFLLAPAGFVLSGVFAEATFLALVLGAFVAVRKERYLVAGTCGFLAALTRPLGVLLVIPLAILSVSGTRGKGRTFTPKMLFLLLVPAGLACFSLFLALRTGDPLAFVHAQKAWGRGLATPWAVLSWGLHHAEPARRFAAWSAILALALVIAFFRRLGAAYGTYALYSILIPLCTGLTAMPRYLVAAFPLAIALALAGRDERVGACLLAALALLQGFLMVFWATGFTLVV